MSPSSLVSYESTGSLGIVQLDDGKANAMRTDWFAALHEALDAAEAASVKAVLLRGRPGIFSGGLDLKFLPTLDASSLPGFTRAFAEAMLRVWTFPVPTIAEITGHAIAGGCVLASACDRRLGLAGAFRYQMNEHWIGIDLPSWMRSILSTAWSAPALERLLVTGEAHSPEQARDAGMLESIAFDPEALSASARGVGEMLANLQSGNVAAYKRRFRQPDVERVLAELVAA
jgi:enoyl-CoA hydratase